MKFSKIYVGIIAAILTLFPMVVQAQTIIRDTEIENYLSEWFAPIFEANGMSPSQVDIILVQSNELNAFVAGGSNIFIYTGLIDRTDHPGELIGVMAHELAHITGGHLVRGRKAMEQASYESILGTIIGVGAAVASGDAGAAVGGSAAGNSMATRRFLSTTRSFEASADQAAIKSMEAANLNPEGLLTFMQKLEGEELLPQTQQSEYIRSHPLTRNRIDALQSRVSTSTKTDLNFPSEWIEQHARMKAKLVGFINPGHVGWTYDDQDNSVAAIYARSIAAYRQDDINKAVKLMDILIAQEPKNAYFYEIKGQMLVDFGRIDEALPLYQKASNLDPQSGLIRMALAQAQIQQNNASDAQLKDAIDNLRRAAQEEPRSTRVHRLLATAYGKMGKDSNARLHLAEEALLQNKRSYAKEQAEIALRGLPSGGTASLRARDIIFFVDQNRS